MGVSPFHYRVSEIMIQPYNVTYQLYSVIAFLVLQVSASTRNP